MSFVMVNRELVTDKRINGNEYRVHTFLLLMYNENKACAFPSISVIAEKVNMSESTVKRCLKKLEELGYITIEKRKGLAGNFNVYKKLKHLILRNNKVKKEVTIINEENVDKETNFEGNNVDCNCDYIDHRSEEQKELDNNVNVRLARSVTNIDKSNFAKTILSMADEELVREAIRNFKSKKGKSATFLISILVDEYFKASVRFPAKMLNMLRKGLNNPFLEQPLPLNPIILEFNS
ncbi:helix-turn-helix domain-containing protein [uncultured Clostridium sp.]|jgi:predicted transcriptional regulator|uniref:helix-turn-helix domain-containing protein n=1 Tax=uncultured Clostridium sp. TaxID=59620 RepID=UPI00261B1493|nr:helix-turn-helix domain-containing protein [uncultured Clostridium sp.]MCI9110282.1 helix-turn-helix domain-containing protein [Bacilli bacterium]